MFFVQLWSLHNSVIHTLSLNNCCLLRSYILWVTYFGQYLWTKCTHVVNNGQTIGYSKGFSLLQWTFIARAIVFRFAVGDIIFFSTYCYFYLQFSTNPMLTHVYRINVIKWHNLQNVPKVVAYSINLTNLENGIPDLRLLLITFQTIYLKLLLIYVEITRVVYYLLILINQRASWY